MLVGAASADTGAAAAAQIERGEYVARAAGCMSCHGEDLVGGDRVKTR